LVFHHPVGQGVAAVLAGALAVVGPHGGGSGAGHVAAHHELNWKNGGLAAHDAGGVRGVKHVVGHQMLGLLEPPVIGRKNTESARLDVRYDIMRGWTR